MKEEVVYCTWTRDPKGDFPAQEAYKTSCGKYTAAYLSTVQRYTTCPFCKNRLKIGKEK